MRDYRQAFTEMAAAIAADPHFVVEAFATGDPLAPDAIAALEAETGYVLTDALRGFYAQMDGLRLKWSLDPDLDPAEQLTFAMANPDRHLSNSDAAAADAAIRILPLRDVLALDWRDELYYEPEFGFHGRELSLEAFHESLRPFDVFSDYRARILGFTDKRDPRVFLLDDNHGVWDESKGTDVESYLEFILATRGESDERKRWLYAWLGYDQTVTFRAP